MDLAIIIVSYNVRELLVPALESLYADLDRSELNAHIIVVDNASQDDSVSAVRKQFPHVELIVSDENLGFAGANNLAMRRLGFGGNVPAADLPGAVYLLNPDTLTKPGATRALYDVLMSHPLVGLVGAQLSYGNGDFQHSAFSFPGLRQIWTEFFPIPGRLVESRFNGRYPRELYRTGEPFSVDFMLGATMMLKREVIMDVGLFDPQFFVYCEEIDWQWRMQEAGWRILCVPQAQVVHLEGQSAGKVKPRSVQYLWKSRLKLFEKHYPLWKLWIAKRMVALGMSRKIRQAQSTNTDPEVVDAYRHIQAQARS